VTCTCTRYVVDYSDPERYHPENMDREDDPNCPEHHPVDADPVTFADTCCGHCPFGTCYVDQMTGA
jgi:hypothetical protein